MAEYPEIVYVDKQDTFDQWRLKHNLLIDAMNALDSNSGDTADLNLGSATTMVDAANAIWAAVMENKDNIGDLSLLETSNNENLVAAINSLKTEREEIVGDLADLVTDDISSIVSAINSIDKAVGKRADLTTEDTTNLVAALNKLSARMGDLSALETDVTHRDTIVEAINNVISKIGSINLSGLQTKTKSNLISAINEMVGRINQLETLIDINRTNIGDLTALLTEEKSNVVGAINELHTDIGDLSTLKTNAKKNLVTAVNEIHEEIGNRDNLTTEHKDTLVGAINEINVWQKNATTGDLYFQGDVAIGKTSVATGYKLDVDGTIKADKFVGNLEGNVKGNVVGNVTGNVTGTSSKWAQPISLTLTGDVTGTVSFDGSSNVSMTTTFPNGPFAPASHNHDDRYVKLSDKRDGVYVNVRNTGSTSSASTGINWAFRQYPNSGFSTGDFMFVDRKYTTYTSGYAHYRRRTVNYYYRDIWLKYTASHWLLLSSSRI